MRNTNTKELYFEIIKNIIFQDLDNRENRGGDFQVFTGFYKKNYKILQNCYYGTCENIFVQDVVQNASMV